MSKLPSLPTLLNRKLYKTGQTRGATTKEIYQNRVGRNSTVLIPWENWVECKTPDDGSEQYENGFIVLVNPDWYRKNKQADYLLAREGIKLGFNAVLFFNQRNQYNNFPIKPGETLSNGQRLEPPVKRESPIGGNLLTRLHGTTSKQEGSGRIDIGFTETKLRGAGIRVYEYASSKNISETRIQLEAVFWMINNSLQAVIEEGMSEKEAKFRKEKVTQEAIDLNLLNEEKLKSLRIIDEENSPICPLCLENIDALDFFSRSKQAEGRETWDNTVTEISLFHIDELRVGKLQHKPYNLGWGHHYCNVVAKDAGLEATIQWMKRVVERNLGPQENYPKSVISELFS